MKKINLIIMPLISISLLASCEDNVEPNYNVSYAGSHCKGASFDNSPSYSFQTAWINENEDFKITLTPDPNYYLPDNLSILFDGIEGSLNTDYTYNQNDGEITIKKHANVLLNLTAIKSNDYMVYFEANGGKVTSVNPFSVPNNGTILNPPTLADRPGYDESLVKWYKEPTFSNEFTFGAGGTTVTNDMTLYAKWGDIDEYTVHFYSSLDETETPTPISQDQTIKYNHIVQRPEEPEEEGYTFTGWYDAKTGGNAFNFDTPLTGEDKTIALYAQFAVKECKITYITNGGTLGANHIDTVKYGKTITTKPDISRFRYDSNDVTWWLDQEMTSDLFDFGEEGVGTEIKGDTILYAKWGNPSCLVTLYADKGAYGGTIALQFMVKEGSKLLPILKEHIPTLTDSSFAYYEYVNKDQPIRYNDLVTSDISVKAKYFANGTTFANLDDLNWTTIKNIVVTGDPVYRFRVGLEKTVIVNGLPHKVRLIGLNHDERIGSTSSNQQFASLTFEFANVITKNNGSAETAVWTSGETATNEFYPSSTINTFLNDTIFNKLPDDLKSDGVIEEVYKPVATGTDYTVNNSFSTKLFPLSYREMTATGTYFGVKDEGSAYPYYTEEGDEESFRTKGLVNAKDSTSYWLRSPHTIANTTVWSVASNGNFAATNLISNNGIAPAFCI